MEHRELHGGGTAAAEGLGDAASGAGEAEAAGAAGGVEAAGRPGLGGLEALLDGRELGLESAGDARGG